MLVDVRYSFVHLASNKNDFPAMAKPPFKGVVIRMIMLTCLRSATSTFTSLVHSHTRVQ
jgi:hypothetical protein